MRLKRISIKNIKSFKSEVAIDLDDNLNILIGPNGGGKSNLLSIVTIILNHYFYKQFQPSYKVTAEQKTREQIQDKESFGNINSALEKYFGDTSDSLISISMQSDEADFNNMKLLSSYKEEISERVNKYSANYQLNYPDGWPDVFSRNQDMEYHINNYNLVQPATGTAELAFLYYLNNYHKFKYFTDGMDNVELYSPLIFFPPSRTLSGNLFIDHQNLKQVDHFNRLSNVSQFQSKSGNVSLVDIAMSHFGRKKRFYEKQAARSNNSIADDLYESDEEVKILSKYLKKIGYGWKIEEEEAILRYRFSLLKGDAEFDITKASSGEQEILNFLLGIFSLNVQGGIVFIDEPELHLHPKWQMLLLEIINDLSATKNNQFIISTHSPTFVNPTTYNHIIRVYKNSRNESQVVVINDVEPFDLKDVLHIVNSTNNEKMFFADVVVLVEGITDRLVFSKIFDELLAVSNKSEVFEVIEVKGKTNLSKFRKFLDKLQIPSFYIADLDYINEVGTDEIKSLFQLDSEKIEKDVIKNKKSKDGDSLVSELEEAISGNDIKSLKSLWEYIKLSRRKLKPDLSSEESMTLSSYLDNLEKENIYILRDGDIEKYFMNGFKTKDLNKVISLLKEENYFKWVADGDSSFRKLRDIAEKIITKSTSLDKIQS